MLSRRFRAPVPPFQQPLPTEEMGWWDILNETLALLQHMIFMLIEFPMTILGYLGIQLPNFCSPLFSVCVCGALTGVACATGIGLGVGLGVGLSCAKSYVGSTTNSTFTNVTNTTITGNDADY
ncbi:unnamed protein product [Adineta ricciae]|uniref:Uncharacterized protein n=1 Tax=Adineta ricciae TaxID=249248 RepID=A0A814FPL7_ADIRI|nr:unnamed protein product [Adineta ricciae]CAF1266473.1 unnamed protein product [Adineta ricciae]